MINCGEVWDEGIKVSSLDAQRLNEWTLKKREGEKCLRVKGLELRLGVELGCETRLGLVIDVCR